MRTGTACGFLYSVEIQSHRTYKNGCRQASLIEQHVALIKQCRSIVPNGGHNVGLMEHVALIKHCRFIRRNTVI